MRRIPTWLRALVFFVVLAVLTIGRYAVVHPRTVCACGGGADPALFMWGLSWWPHALAHGMNPFVTHYQWSPTGVNLAQATMIPTAAIVMAPFTMLFGPLFSFNAVAIASPALTAFTAYLLCRYIVKRELPAVLGGFLFGFSSFEFAQLLGHLHLVTIFLIPVFVHITLRRVDRKISRRTYMLSMALLLVLQMGLSTELLAECVMLGGVLLIAARFLAAQPQRSRMNGLIVETVLAGLVAIVVSSPFLYYAFISGGAPPGNPLLADVFPLDLTNLFSPTVTTWLGHNDFHAVSSVYDGGDASEANGYLGIALLIGFATWFFTGGKHSVLGKLLAIAIAVSVVMAFGTRLHIAGYQTVTMPWNLVKNLPIFDYIIPSRIVLYAALAISIGLAAWLARTDRNALGRWLLVLLGALMIFPNINSSLYGAKLLNPSFFSTPLYRKYLTRNETVLILPFSYHDVSTLWQAESGFYFYMPEGYVAGTIPPAFQTQPGAVELFTNVAPSPANLLAFIHEHHVSHVVVDPTMVGPWPGLLAQLGLHGRSAGGVLLYSVPGAPG
jgi:hypothetical protein